MTRPAPAGGVAVPDVEVRALRVAGRVPASARARRTALGVAAVAVTVSVVAALAVDGGVVNPGGRAQLTGFLAAAVRPSVAPAFLAVVWRAALTTVAYAVVGTTVAMALGLVGGIVVAESWWRRPGPARGPRAGWYALRGVLAVPRGVHEAVWGLLLVAVLGLDPLVAVLAIGIPFGAVSAKVVGEIIDDAAGPAWSALRDAGVGRLAALWYAVLPVAGPGIVSYGFYRLECAVRSAAILGVIGAGGLGFELALSFQALRYDEMWTLIWALVAVSGVADAWSARVRHADGRHVGGDRGGSRPADRGRAHTARPRARRVARWSLVAGAVLVAVSVHHLSIDVATLWAPDTRRLAADLAREAWPPRLTGFGPAGLLRASLATLQMSVVAIAAATAVAVPAAFVAARGAGAVHRVVAPVARLVLLVARAVPPPVWAFVLLLVLFPGVLPGAVALAVYNAGVLGRLLAEVVEHLDRRPAQALTGLGASPGQAVAYGVLPLAVPRFTGYALYRWEVVLRETVIVGLVGAGGLGRLLGERQAAFDMGAVLTVVVALIVLSAAVDVASAALRRRLR